MVKDAGKATNVRKAVFDYAVAHNATWPAADLVNYQMGWCDCENVQAVKKPPNSGYFGQCDNNSPVIQHNCPDGKVAVAFEMKLYDDYQYQIPCKQASSAGNRCCRPCFKASSSSSKSMVETRVA